VFFTLKPIEPAALVLSAAPGWPRSSKRNGAALRRPPRLLWAPESTPDGRDKERKRERERTRVETGGEGWKQAGT